MKLVLAFFLNLVLCLNCFSQSSFNKKNFYSVLSKSELSILLNEEKKIPSQPSYSAYSGALFMKKAGLLSDPSQKLKVFQSGREKLENAIKSDSTNTEWRLLRLIIQENSPKILQYNQQIQADALYLRNNYSKLDDEAQNALYAYSRTSHVLNEKDFKHLKHE